MSERPEKTHTPKPPIKPQSRRWLCIAYAFPPILRSGTHRTLGFVQQLSRSGWDATVLTVKPGGEPVDVGLLAQVPPTARVVSSPWLDPIAFAKRLDPRTWFASDATHSANAERHAAFVPSRSRSTGMIDWLTAWLQIPDSRIGWILPGVLAGLEAIRRDKSRVIYSTSPYASAHLIALVLRELTRLPWVADFRDPWRGNPFRCVPHAAADRWDAWLESAVLHRASRVICNTPTMTKALQARKPAVAEKCVTILNGFDSERYVDVSPRRVVDDDQIAVVHAGQFYGPRSPMPWFRALRQAIELAPDHARRLRLVLLGPDTFEGRSLAALASQCGVARQVCVLGNRCHETALSMMAGADALALAGASGHGAHLQVPNKLFECLALRRPIIASVVRASPVRAILEAAGARAVVCDPANAHELSDALIALATHRSHAWHGTWAGVDQFDRAHAARQLVEVLEHVTRRRRSPRLRKDGALQKWAVQAIDGSASTPSDLRAQRVPERVSEQAVALTHA